MADKKNAAKEKNQATKKPGFIKSVKTEAKKVTWYSKAATLKSTVALIIVLVIFAAVIGLVDLGFVSLLGLFA